MYIIFVIHSSGTLFDWCLRSINIIIVSCSIYFTMHKKARFFHGLLRLLSRSNIDCGTSTKITTLSSLRTTGSSGTFSFSILSSSSNNGSIICPLQGMGSATRMRLAVCLRLRWPCDVCTLWLRQRLSEPFDYRLSDFLEIGSVNREQRWRGAGVAFPDRIRVTIVQANTRGLHGEGAWTSKGTKANNQTQLNTTTIKRSCDHGILKVLKHTAQSLLSFHRWSFLGLQILSF